MKYFSSINDQEFLINKYRQECYYGKAGDIGKKLQLLFEEPVRLLESLGSQIIEDLFIFRDGIACKQSIFFDHLNNRILWSNIKKMYDQEGATIYLRGLQKYIGAVEKILSLFKEDIKDRIPFANIFITPPSSTGLNPHFDPTEFFVYQIFGKKYWNIWDAPLNYKAEAMMPEEMELYCKNMTSSNKPRQEILLAPQEAIYMPIYQIHAPRTESENSCHVTVGLAHLDLKKRRR